jgi:hypothetical protein
MADPLATLADFYALHVRPHGAILAGALFGVGWWCFADAVVAIHPHSMPVAQALPGVAATLALVLINAVRWDELRELDPWDEGVYCRSRVWLLAAYAVCLGSVGGAAAVMVHTGGGEVGLRCVLQVAAILGAALLLFTSRSEGDSGEGGYGAI